MKIGELGVLPAVRGAAPSTLVLADGFSCRTQIEQGDTGRRALHLAEALALGLDGPLPADHPEKLAARPEPSARDARLATASAGLAARRRRGRPLRLDPPAPQVTRATNSRAANSPAVSPLARTPRTQ